MHHNQSIMSTAAACCVLKALVTGLSDLGRLFDGVHLPPPEPLGDPGLEKTRLFGAVDPTTCIGPTIRPVLPGSL